ncbi:MAG TPA: hypothetical protein VKG92_10070 [Flavobacteriales bacterium]|nr:hypothetical protein [Flavobacteriales bacterium]
MRHLLLLPSLLLLVQGTVHAQFNKGDLVLSLGGSYKSKEYDLKETLDSQIDLQIGYYPVPRIGVGLAGNWGLSRFSYAQPAGDITYTNFKEGHWGGIGPYVRGHLGHPDFSVFGQLGAVFGSVDQDLENNLTTGIYSAAKQKGTYQQYSFAFGAWWYFTRRLGVEVLGTADWVYAQIQYGTVGADGEVTYADTSHHDDSGGGFSLRLVYWFRLDKGAKKPQEPGG